MTVFYFRSVTNTDVESVKTPEIEKSVLVPLIKDPIAAESHKPPPPGDPLLARLVDSKIKAYVRLNLDIQTRIPSVKNPEDYPALVYCLKDISEEDTIRNEVANLLKRSHYPGLANALIDVLDNPSEKPRFRSFAVQHLGELSATGESSILAKLRQCLDDKDAEVRREALLALVRQKDDSASQAAVRQLADVETRDLAIRCVRELDLREQIPNVRKYLNDSNEVVRIAAIVALSQWFDDESRTAFDDAAASKSMRLQSAGAAALARLDSLERVLPLPQQNVAALAKVLKSEKPALRHAAVRALRKYNEEIAPAVPAIAAALMMLDNKTRTVDVAAYLETIRVGGTAAAGAAPMLVDLLQERSAIYNGRPMADVHRIRGYILLTLADIGAADKALPYIAEYLANSDRELSYTFTCAAHAAQSLTRHPASFVAMVQRGLTDEITDKPIWLAAFNADTSSLAAATSPRLEAIRTLAVFGPESAPAIPLLEKLEKDPAPKFIYLRYAEEARRAISVIQSLKAAGPSKEKGPQ